MLSNQKVKYGEQHQFGQIVKYEYTRAESTITSCSPIFDHHIRSLHTCTHVTHVPIYTRDQKLVKHPNQEKTHFEEKSFLTTQSRTRPIYDQRLFREPATVGKLRGTEGDQAPGRIDWSDIHSPNGAAPPQAMPIGEIVLHQRGTSCVVRSTPIGDGMGRATAPFG